MSDQTKWFSQTLLTFKDKQYATDGYLRVAISTNTEDYKYFNPPMFNISISNANNYQKTANLNIQNAEDLLTSFQKVLKTMNGEDVIVEKHYNKKAKLYFKFSLNSSTGERVITIEIFSNDSDAVKVIIPAVPTFQSLGKRLKYFVENYDMICMRLLEKAINFESNQIIQQLPGLIKGISSQIIEQDIAPDSRAPEPEKETVAEMDTTNYDFEKFLGEDMENVKIPEIEDGGYVEQKEAAPAVKVDSPFVEKVLKNDLINLESKLTSFAVSKNPVLDLAEDLRKQLGFDVLAGINEDDKKSLSYISKVMTDFHSKSYTINNVPVPDKTPTLKFKGKDTEENMEFAKDLLTIIGFMRILRRRLETKFDNAYDSKALVYIYLRFVMDSYCFSFLQNFTHSEIKSAIANRFKYFNEVGVFDAYHNIIKTNNCSEITLSDLEAFAEEVYDSIIKTPMISEVHEMLHSGGSLKLPSKNTFNLEQIINEFVVLEVNQMMGFDFKDSGAVDKLKESGITDEMLKFFIGNKKVQKSGGIKTKKITPLQRVVEKFKQDIPEQYREEVIDHVTKLGYDKFDFETCKWPLEEFDSRVVVAFYVWDVEADPDMKTNFQHFMSLVESEQMTKDDIIIAYKETESPKKEEATFGFEDINFELD